MSYKKERLASTKSELVNVQNATGGAPVQGAQHLVEANDMDHSRQDLSREPELVSCIEV